MARINVQAYTIYDWKGPTSGVKFRIYADDSFIAREADNSGSNVESGPVIFREVDCTVNVGVVVNSLTMNTLTIPALWLYSTTDAITNNRARYSAVITAAGGREIERPDLFQSFQIPPEIINVINPTTWTEIVRFNHPNAPIMVDRETYSKQQILDLFSTSGISSAARATPTAAAMRVAVWDEVLVNFLDGATTLTWDESAKRLALSDGQARFIQTSGNTPVHIRGLGSGSTRILSLTDNLDTEILGISRQAVLNVEGTLSTGITQSSVLAVQQDNFTFGGAASVRMHCQLLASANVDITGFVPASGSVNGQVYFWYNRSAFNITLKHQSGSSTLGNRFFGANSADVVLPPGGVAMLTRESQNSGEWFVSRLLTFTGTPVTAEGTNTFTGVNTFNNTVDFNNPITIDGGSTFSTLATFNGTADFNGNVTIDGGMTASTAVIFNGTSDFNAAMTVDAQSDFSVLSRHSANMQLGVSGVGTCVTILDDNAVGTSDIRAIDNAQGVRFFATNTFGNNDGARLHLYGTAHANTGQAFLEAVGNASAFISFGTSVSGAAVERHRLTALGETIITPGVRTTGGTVRYLRVITPADTGLTADTESIGIQFGGTSAGTPTSATRQFTQGAGSFTVQRECVFVHPTYGATTTETIARAATVSITNAPQPGTNMTLTQALAFHVEAGFSRFDGNIIGSDNRNAQILVDATVAAGIPASRVLLNPTGQPTQIGTFQYGQTSSIGTRSLFFQLTPDQSAGFASFEGVNSAGVIINNSGNTNPVWIQVNSVEKARFDTNGLLTLSGPASATAGFIAALESGDATNRFFVSNDGKVQGRSGTGATPATDFISMGGPYWNNTSVLFNSSTTETDLQSKTTPANWMGQDGDSAKFMVIGNWDGTAATKTTRVYFAGSVIVAITVAGGAGSQAQVWRVDGELTRVDASNVRYSLLAHLGPVAGTTVTQLFAREGTVAFTAGNTNIFKCTGQGGASNQINQTLTWLWKGTFAS